MSQETYSTLVVDGKPIIKDACLTLYALVICTHPCMCAYINVYVYVHITKRKMKRRSGSERR